MELVTLLPDYERFLREFYLQGFDIGLAPLPDTLFHRSKNNTKFRDYGACRVAGVYSDVDIYSCCVKDGQTGILVPNTTDGWFRGISKLIDDQALTKRIQDEAYASVYAEYRQELVEEEWMSEISSLLVGNRGYAGRDCNGKPSRNEGKVGFPRTLRDSFSWPVGRWRVCRQNCSGNFY